MAWSGYILDLVAVAGFELGWAEVAEGAVQAGAVVPADVLSDGGAGGSSGGPGLVVEQLAFDGGEPAFGQSVIPALPGPAMGQLDIETAGQGGEFGGCVLASPVGVEDHSRRGVAGSDRVGQRCGDQFGAQVIGHGVADDAAGGDVDDGSQVQPP